MTSNEYYIHIYIYVYNDIIGVPFLYEYVILFYLEATG